MNTLCSTFSSPLTYKDRAIFPTQPPNYQTSPQIPLGPVYLLKPSIRLQVTMSANGQSKGVIGSMANSAADRRRVSPLRLASRIAIIIWHRLTLTVDITVLRRVRSKVRWPPQPEADLPGRHRCCPQTELCRASPQARLLWRSVEQFHQGGWEVETGGRTSCQLTPDWRRTRFTEGARWYSNK